jgi:D-glycero-D-manno-heptose 1,7-bisphosphate phosphatase
VKTRRAAAERVVILDRDGTIVIDRGYLADPAGLEFLANAAQGLQWFHANGYRLVVISNQSGVGRGLFPLERVHAMNGRLERMVEGIGARLAAIYFCPHAPDADCDCRKPAQGLLKRAAAELHFDPASAIVIGDRDSDIEFGRRAGAMTILIAPDAEAQAGAGEAQAGAGDAAARVRPDARAANLSEAARIVAANPRYWAESP